MSETHSSVVRRQFGAQAAAYVTSAVHAAGEDLDWIEARLAAVRPASALDLGCGGGHVSYRAGPHAGRVVACDLSADMLAAVAAEAERRGLRTIETRQARAEALPFEAGSFDAVATRFSTHHWSDAAAGLREAARVLAPGGLFLASDVSSPGVPLLDTHLQAVELLRDPSHVRDYGAREWAAMVEAAGLELRHLSLHRLRMEFPVWIARMRTPDVAANAIRFLQDQLSEEGRRHFAVEPDGSFTLDTIRIEAVKPGAAGMPD